MPCPRARRRAGSKVDLCGKWGAPSMRRASDQTPAVMHTPDLGGSLRTTCTRGGSGSRDSDAMQLSRCEQCLAQCHDHLQFIGCLRRALAVPARCQHDTSDHDHHHHDHHHDEQHLLEMTETGRLQPLPLAVGSRGSRAPVPAVEQLDAGTPRSPSFGPMHFLQMAFDRYAAPLWQSAADLGVALASFITPTRWASGSTRGDETGAEAGTRADTEIGTQADSSHGGPAVNAAGCLPRDKRPMRRSAPKPTKHGEGEMHREEQAVMVKGVVWEKEGKRNERRFDDDGGGDEEQGMGFVVEDEEEEDMGVVVEDDDLDDSDEEVVVMAMEPASEPGTPLAAAGGARHAIGGGGVDAHADGAGDGGGVDGAARPARQRLRRRSSLLGSPRRALENWSADAGDDEAVPVRIEVRQAYRTQEIGRVLLKQEIPIKVISSEFSYRCSVRPCRKCHRPHPYVVTLPPDKHPLRHNSTLGDNCVEPEQLIRISCPTRCLNSLTDEDWYEPPLPPKAAGKLD
eukprot:m.148473 g.148473  ORF g.148473 m.148473 type:complete len:513 (+) comp17315_c1_seq2:1031-2569(+)